MDEGMGGTQKELTPIMCLCALYEVTKKALLNHDDRAACEACFNITHKALEDAQKPAPKKKAARKRRKK